MCEILKYRGKNRRTGEWVTGIPIRHDDEIILLPAFMDETDTLFDLWQGIEYCLTETIGQFTGRKDNGKTELYEGDIVKCEVMKNGRKERSNFVIVWENEIAGFMLLGDKYRLPFPNRFEFQNTMELIGNIYDNENALGMIVKQAYFDRKSMKPCDTCAEGNQADLQSNINRNGRIGERRNRKGKLAQSGR